MLGIDLANYGSILKDAQIDLHRAGAEGGNRKDHVFLVWQQEGLKLTMTAFFFCVCYRPI